MEQQDNFAGQPLLERDFHRADYARTRWFVRVPSGVSFSTVTQPDYWANTARRMKVGDLIEVLALDGSFDAELRVTFAAPLYVKVRVMREWHASAEDEAQPKADLSPVDIAEHRVEWAGKHKWRVVDKNNNIVAKDMSSRDEATKALNEYLSKKNAA